MRESPIISGVRNRSREESTKESFDKSALKADHPDVFAEFVAVGEPSTAVGAVPDRGFQIWGSIELNYERFTADY